MIKFFNISSIFVWIEKLINFINSIFFILLLIAISIALIFSPADYLQGDSVRIMYVHVPAAWIALGSFSSLALLSFLNFIFKIKNLSLISKSIAPIGLMFTFLAIVTGSLWGRPTWGTFWVWDARITSMVILAFFYFLFILSHKLILDEEKANRISSLVAIIGFINIPIIKYSVDWWNTLHQPASIKITGASTIHSSMMLPLFLMFFVLILYCALIFLMKYKTEIIKIKKKNFKKIMIKDLIYMNGYGIFVWLSFFITFVVCGVVYLKTYKTLKKYEKEFASEIQELSSERKKIILKKSRVASQALSSYKETI